MSMKKISRRQFLAKSGRVAGGLAAAGTLASCTTESSRPAFGRRAIGANEQVNVAVIGIRNQGGVHLQSLAKIPNVRVKTLCDIDENLFAGRVKEIEEIAGYQPGVEPDMRKVFEDKEIDAVTIATPNHWHALATIWACQAGKHVYVEKPCSATIRESTKMIEAARKYNRVVEVGLQNRSISNVRQAIKFLAEGGIGDIYMARTICLKGRDSIGIYPDGPSTEEAGNWPLYGYPRQGKVRPCSAEYLKKVHYDLWLGPAPKRRYNRNRFHYNWHWHWDYGSGDIGNTSPHAIDIAVWGMNKKALPVKIYSTGGYFAFDSAQQTPNTQISVFKYADGTILQNEVRGVYTNAEGEDVKIGNFFYGTKGWMHINGSEWKTYFGRNNRPGPTNDTAGEFIDPSILSGTGGDAHFKNFIGAVRSGNREDLTCDISVGYMSAVLPHLANISYRLGREVTYFGAKGKFVGDKEADKMLTRKYRKPYVVPEDV